MLSAATNVNSPPAHSSPPHHHLSVSSHRSRSLSLCLDNDAGCSRAVGCVHKPLRPAERRQLSVRAQRKDDNEKLILDTFARRRPCDGKSTTSWQALRASWFAAAAGSRIPVLRCLHPLARSVVGLFRRFPRLYPLCRVLTSCGGRSSDPRLHSARVLQFSYIIVGCRHYT
jgi:hypothetical protein